MYIEPNTTIKFCKGVRLDPTYQHTIYFDSISDQLNFFNSKVKIVRDKKYYNRIEKNTLIINVPVETLYDCNYMMFQNESFSNKWFYAFILSVDYRTNTSCIITYQIDTLQTWFFDFTIMPSFVLREHSQTDVAGDNIVPEEVLSDVQYINSSIDELIHVTKTYILYSTIMDNQGEWQTALSTSNGNLIQCYDHYPVDGIAQAKAFIDTYLDGHEDAILGLVPSLRQVQMTLSRPVSIGDYTPRNKKLLTGQYCRYTFELAGNSMEIPLDVVPNPTVTSYTDTSLITPGDHIEYRVWLSNYANSIYPTSMSLAIPVQVSKWAYNDYANSVALQAEATAIMLAREENQRLRGKVDAGFGMAKGVSSAITGVGTAITTGGASLAVGGATQITAGIGNAVDSGFQYYQFESKIDEHTEALARHHANMQASATGASVNGMELMKYNQLYLSGYVWTVLPQDARRIDKFFDMYGYAINEVKIPNRNFRPHWNYVKTSGLEIEYNCPMKDAEFIKAIHENGITYWKNGDEVGDYSLDNTIQ